MSEKTICKTVHQYNKESISDADMQKFLEIARDYCRVKNETYQRYGGIGGLTKLYPGYTVQKELASSGLREQLELPSVYFNLAIFDAVTDIKSQWTRTKSVILEKVNQKEDFTEEEKHYLHFILKVSNVFIAVVTQTKAQLPKDIEKNYDKLQEKVNVEKLHRYLCRQVRNCHVKLKTEKSDGFSLTERAYRYADHGIYISIKEKRKRIFVPLTDNNQYVSQIFIKLFPEEHRLEIKVPIQVKVREQKEFTNCIGIALGMYTMVTTNEGHSYGKEFGNYQIAYADWIRNQNISYYQNKEHNPGRKKYEAKKHRMKEQMYSYINCALNEMLREEKPNIIYIVKSPKTKQRSGNKVINHSVSLWQRGYIRKRLEQKCKENAIELVEVLGKDISRECSQCGAVTLKKIEKKETEATQFICEACGFEIEEKTNTAKNVLKRGRNGNIVK